jgi:hypothetical protein
MAVHQPTAGQDTVASGWTTPGSMGSGADQEDPLKVMALPLASMTAQKSWLAHETWPSAGDESIFVRAENWLPFQYEA